MTIRTMLDGSGPYLWAALVFSVLGVLLLLAQLLSPDLVIWNGHCVPVLEQGGLAYLKVNGQTYTIDDVQAPANAPDHTVTVCYYADHPEEGVIPRPAAYWFEASLVGVPFLIALTILILGLVIVPFRVRRRGAHFALWR
jgi:hypothetical protein